MPEFTLALSSPLAGTALDPALLAGQLALASLASYQQDITARLRRCNALGAGCEWARSGSSPSSTSTRGGSTCGEC